MIHLIECENPLMKKFIDALLARSKEKGTYYKNIWVMHYQEDVAYRAYLSWSCKKIADQTESQVSALPEFERQAYIYENMVKVGEKSSEAKNQKDISKNIQEEFRMNIPVGDQIGSVVNNNENLFTLAEFCEYCFETPDIQLEREQ